MIQVLQAPFVPLKEIEKTYILYRLAHFDGNKTQTAKSLGITLKTLYNKLYRYGVMKRKK